jgi:hypothetical protein
MSDYPDSTPFWNSAQLRERLRVLARDATVDSLKYAINILEIRAPKPKPEPVIDWSNTFVGNDKPPEYFIDPAVLKPAVEKLRAKMKSIQDEVARKEAAGEDVGMDD